MGSGRSDFRPCADGHFGDVMKVYRDWKICGDTEWLRSLWPSIVSAIAFAWHPDNDDRWDPDKTGVLWGRQHHTLDMELFGPNAWLTGFYLGALKAAAEMADHLDEPELAAEYRDLFEKGKSWADAHLFNGEYYHQLIDLNDRTGCPVSVRHDNAISERRLTPTGTTSTRRSSTRSLKDVRSIRCWRNGTPTSTGLARSSIRSRSRPRWHPSSSTTSKRPCATTTIPAASIASMMKRVWSSRPGPTTNTSP